MTTRPLFEPRRAPQAYNDLIVKLWRDGHNTYLIAASLNFTEASVYNALSHAREAERTRVKTEEAVG